MRKVDASVANAIAYNSPFGRGISTEIINSPLGLAGAFDLFGHAGGARTRVLVAKASQRFGQFLHPLHGRKFGFPGGVGGQFTQILHGLSNADRIASGQHILESVQLGGYFAESSFFEGGNQPVEKLGGLVAGSFQIMLEEIRGAGQLLQVRGLVGHEYTAFKD